MLAKSTSGMLLTAEVARPWSAAWWTCWGCADVSSGATACSIQDVKAAARPHLPGILLTGTRLRWLLPAAVSQQRIDRAYAPHRQTPSSAAVRARSCSRPTLDVMPRGPEPWGIVILMGYWWKRRRLLMAPESP